MESESDPLTRRAVDLFEKEPLKGNSEVHLHTPTKFGEDRSKDLGGDREQTDRQTNRQTDKRCSIYSMIQHQCNNIHLSNVIPVKFELVALVRNFYLYRSTARTLTALPSLGQHYSMVAPTGWEGATSPHPSPLYKAATLAIRPSRPCNYNQLLLLLLQYYCSCQNVFTMIFRQ